jgi:vancomycin resistance protein YoaR
MLVVACRQVVPLTPEATVVGPTEVAKAPPSPGATPAPATAVPPSPTVDDRERAVRLTLGTQGWNVTVRGPTAVGIETALAPLAADVAKPARDARLRINKDGTLDWTPSQPGVAIDTAATAERVRAAVAQGKAEAELATLPVQPGLRDDQYASAKTLLEGLLGKGDGPVVTVKGAEKSWTLDRAETADILAFDFPKGGGEPVKVVLDEWPARAFIGRLAKAIDKPASEARFAWNGGKPKPIREGTSGRALDQDAAFKAFERALTAGERSVELPIKTVDPKITTGDAEAFNGAALIESGSTAFGGAIPEKRWNIKLAAERLNGTVVPPGGTFSFNNEVGPTTLESGFKWGFGITSGSEGIKTVPSVAGGICQVATTLFQPVFWAGYPLEERYWHLYWIPSYASRGIVGLDVTVDADSNLDFKWINLTKTPVLIQAGADDEKVSFQLYGKKPDWTVKVDPAKISNRVPPDTTPVTEEDATMPWGRNIVVEAAREGFDVEVVRRVLPSDNGEPRVLTLKSNYQPSRNVTLVGTAGKPANATAIPAAQPSGTPAVNRPAVPTTPVLVDSTPAATESPAPAATPVPPPATPTPARPAATPAPAPAKPAASPTRRP